FKLLAKNYINKETKEINITNKIKAVFRNYNNFKIQITIVFREINEKRTIKHKIQNFK
ncbi:hypothetical protein K469DRAFT_586664, partial [Zopfia rhizophila CBS 207.26]